MAPIETEARADIQGMATAETEGTVRAGRKAYSDVPLNYSERKRYINRQLRRLDLESLVQGVRENFGTISSAVLLGGAAAFLLKRRYIVSGNLVLAFLLQQFLLSQRSPKGRVPKDDIDLERYALKTERGDYGKIDFIAFK